LCRYHTHTHCVYTPTHAPWFTRLPHLALVLRLLAYCHRTLPHTHGSWLCSRTTLRAHTVGCSHAAYFIHATHTVGYTHRRTLRCTVPATGHTVVALPTTTLRARTLILTRSVRSVPAFPLPVTRYRADTDDVVGRLLITFATVTAHTRYIPRVLHYGRYTPHTTVTHVGFTPHTTATFGYYGAFAFCVGLGCSFYTGRVGSMDCTGGLVTHIPHILPIQFPARNCRYTHTTTTVTHTPHTHTRIWFHHMRLYTHTVWLYHTLIWFTDGHRLRDFGYFVTRCCCAHVTLWLTFTHTHCTHYTHTHTLVICYYHIPLGAHTHHIPHITRFYVVDSPPHILRTHTFSFTYTHTHTYTVGLHTLHAVGCRLPHTVPRTPHTHTRLVRRLVHTHTHHTHTHATHAHALYGCTRGPAVGWD